LAHKVEANRTVDVESPTGDISEIFEIVGTDTRVITVELTRLSNINLWGALRSFVRTELIDRAFWRRVDIFSSSGVTSIITKGEFVPAASFVLAYAVVTPSCCITVRIVLEGAGG
jgi:hypothetical protein